MLNTKDYFLDGKIKEECGVFGVFNNIDATKLTYYGLHSLQHRGQEGSGIASTDGTTIFRHRGLGLVTEVFNQNNLEELNGNSAIGHVRYSTFGDCTIDNVQPLLIRSHQGDFVIAHNGNIVNAKELKIELESAGSVFQCTSDSEIIGHLIQRESGTFEEKILKALSKLEGAFSFIIMNKDTMYAIRDKNGFRPLSIGKTIDGSIVVSSETSAFEIVGAKHLYSLKSADVIKITKDGYELKKYTSDTMCKMCAMEYIYFSRPDSNINNLNVHSSRRQSGRLLAQDDSINADIVISVPDSSTSAAMGYSDVSGLPFEMGLVKNRYVGRTFIKPDQAAREKGVKMKLAAMTDIVKDKSVVLVDDSIVRGTTSKYIVKLLKEAGAKEVHMRIASPPIIAPCFYGVDTSTYSELISSKLSLGELNSYIGANSLKFLTLDDIENCFGLNICRACFTGDYPTNIFSLKKDV